MLRSFCIFRKSYYQANMGLSLIIAFTSFFTCAITVSSSGALNTLSIMSTMIDVYKRQGTKYLKIIVWITC